MKINFRYIDEQDRQQIIEMMRIFYSSEAVFTDGSDEIFNTDIDNCINENPYIEGYVFESDNIIKGYAMIAKSFSTEFGKPCIWIEDIYIKEEFRGLGIGTFFLNYIQNQYPQSLFRLEVEAENKKAINVYKKCGFDVLPYMEMKTN